MGVSLHAGRSLTEIAQLVFVLGRISELRHPGKIQDSAEHSERMLSEWLQYIQEESSSEPAFLRNVCRASTDMPGAEGHDSMVLLGAFAGLRFGEVVALRKSSFDLSSLHPVVRVQQSLTEVAGVTHLGPPKTKGSVRTVPLPTGPIVEQLRSVVQVRSKEHKAGPIKWAKDSMGELAWGDGDPLVFRSPEGRPISPTRWRARVWKRAVDFLEMDPAPTFHDLRHTYAAQLVRENAHPKVIQDLLGHSSIRTTMDVYGHLMETVPHEQIARLTAALAAE